MVSSPLMVGSSWVGGETYAQPSGVVTPKKQSPLFAWMTWFLKTGVMTTPADTREAAAAMTRAKAVFILREVVGRLRITRV